MFRSEKSILNGKLKGPERTCFVKRRAIYKEVHQPSETLPGDDFVIIMT